jgi:deoxyribose-phosphate aldolase
MELTYEMIAKRIDHSLLGPTLTDAELEAGCLLARDYGVASVCIKPHAVATAARLLKSSGVEVGTTIGFPHGGHKTETKVFEAERALDDGATELDMVVNIGQVLGEQWGPVKADIAAVVETAHRRGAIVKVIFENCYLSPAAIVKLCQICGEVHADYVKTSTGYGTGGATHDDLILMRQAAPSHVKLKAAGGVRTLDEAIAVTELGCDRIGASRTADMLDALRDRIGMAPISRSSTEPGRPGDSY